MAPAAARRRGGDGAAVLRQGFAKHYGGGGGVGEGEGGTKGKSKKSSISPLYIGGPRGGAGPRISNLLGVRPRGGILVTPKLVPMAEIALPIYNSLPPDHSETPRDDRDLIRDSEQLLGYCILISL